MKRAAILLSVCVLLFSGSTAWGRTITVANDGSRDYTSIQDAVDAARDGDVIRVRVGTYYTSKTIRISGKNIYLLGAGNKVCKIVYDGNWVAINFKNVSKGRLSGFDISGKGNETQSIVFLHSSNIVIEHNRIHGAAKLHGIEAQDSSSPTIRNNTIYGNKEGGIAFIRSEGEVYENIVYENGIHGIGASDSNPTIRNNIVYGNKQTGIFFNKHSKGEAYENRVYENGFHGISAKDNSSPTIRNNTTYGNKEVGIWAYSGSSPLIINNIASNNEKGISGERITGKGLETRGYPKARHNILFNNRINTQYLDEDINNVVADPLFVDAANHDFRLHPGSPAIGAGEGGVDIGAIPYKAPAVAARPKPPPIPKPPGDTTPPVITITSPPLSRAIAVRPVDKMRVTIAGTAKDENGVVYVKVNGEETSLDVSSNFSYQAYLAVGENRFTVTAMDPSGNIGEKTFTVQRSSVQSPPVVSSIPDIKSRALLIGLNNYDHWNDLRNPLFDIEKVGKELRENYGFEVTTLKDPTKAAILTAIRKLATSEYEDAEQLLIWFSSHGHFDEVSKIGYIVARDTLTPREDPIFGSYIGYPMLKQTITTIPSRHIFLVVDACYSGTLDNRIAMKGGGDIYADVTREEFIQRKLKFKTRLYLTSGGKEYVSDGRPGYHSPFTRKFLEALRSYGGKDGILTVEETVANYMDKVKPQPRYNEFLGNEPGSSFIFIAR